ncbi:MAG: flagellar biosynthesis protein FliQ [Helicobacteraceae bacterium]|nr:flagellar biosynthesis protein FliQ [Helicobacteraceae bacterium]
MVEGELISLASETFKTALMISAPMLLGGLIAGLLISIFQATTQINEMTLSFVPKILVVAAVLILAMPWMMNTMIDFTVRVFGRIATFPLAG